MTDISSARPAAVVTGASEGIGAELARVFAEKGHEVVIVARRGDRLTALADDIAAKGGKRPVVVALDLLADGAVDALAAHLADADLVPQYLVNNAGFGLIGCIAELDQAEQLAMIDLNIRTLTALTLRFLPSLTETRGGVLNVASVASFMPGPGFAVYYATKAFVRSFSEAISFELKPAGVKVSCLCPGPVMTGFQARAGMSFEGLMGAMKPALVPAEEVARQGYDGLMAGKRVVVPGNVNKLMIWSARISPRALLLPLLGAAQMKRA
jgi:short-subunit dehydrogenase